MSSRIYSSKLFLEKLGAGISNEQKYKSTVNPLESNDGELFKIRPTNKPTIRFCSKRFRDELRALYPRLDAKPERWMFLQYLIYSQHVDEKNNKLIVSAQVLSDWMGKQTSFNNSNFSVRAIAEDFSLHVFPVTLSSYTFNSSKRKFESRTMLSTLPKEIESQWEVERRSRHSPRVEFASGKKAVNPKLCLVSSSAPEASRIMVDYMNALPTNRFSKAVSAHWEEAAAVAASLGEMHTPAGRQSALLAQLLISPKPLYKTALRSARIVSASEVSIANLKRCVRKVLCQDWLHCDLASAQYSINYRIWGMEEAGFPFVASPFETLIADLGLPADARPALKKIIYSICFGMSTRQNPVRVNICDLANAIAPNLWRTMKKHPLIMGLLHTRRKIFRQIKEDEFALNAWGNPIALQPESHDGFPGDNVRSVVAQMAQSYEQRLMFEVYKLAKKNSGKHGFSILVNVYDGLYIQVHDSADIDSWKQRISGAVEEEAIRLGIRTKLDWD